MSISGFSFLRNAERLYYPFIESIKSVLDSVDEYIIMVGESEADDYTYELLQNINSSKIKIYKSKWDIVQYPHGSEYAHQTDLAKSKCSGKWLLYLQGDEVIHEDDLAAIKEACKKHLTDREVEGFVLDFLHFYGDYRHYFRDHTWYRQEIRIIRNLDFIHSWRDAQSFRVIPDFKDNDYFRKKNTRKLNCIALKARIFHYGWVRPPQLMSQKNYTAGQNYSTSKDETYTFNFDYGRVDRTTLYSGTHPRVMNTRIDRLDWTPLLRHSGPVAMNRPKMKHERLKYRILNFIEKLLPGNRSLGGFKNFRLLKR